MEQTKHTPGPNDCICGRRASLITGLSKQQAQVRCVEAIDPDGLCGKRGAIMPNPDQAIADWNQQTAAPDLLEALRQVQTAIKAARAGKTVFWYHYEPIVNAAIAKAEPKS